MSDFSLVFSIGFMWPYRSKNRTELTLGLWRTSVALVGPKLCVSIFLLEYLGIYLCL